MTADVMTNLRPRARVDAAVEASLDAPQDTLLAAARAEADIA